VGESGAEVNRWVPALLKPGAPAEPFEGAVMFADISGFTALSERLAPLGAKGAEKLSEILDGFFERLLTTIAAHGGHVIRIAGDAPLVAWGGPNAKDQAARCALAIQHGTYDGLTLRIALAAGPLQLASLGGVNDRWEWLLWGDCLKELDPAGKLARPGEVVATAAFDGEALQAGFVRVTQPPPGEPEAAPQPPLRDPARLLRYLPAPARFRLEAGHAGWLAELRRVTVMFVNLRGDHTLATLQEAVVTIQEVLAAQEGSLNQFLVDDKGTVCLAAFGLPPRAHHDDPIRAVRAARAIAARLDNVDIGLATGHLFCGPRGSADRKEYCMIGSRVNMAARLMQAARGGILVDVATWEGARHNLEFEVLPPLKVKGRNEPLPVFRPTAERVVTAGLPLVGREPELQLLLELPRGLVWLEGEPGIGKSRLLLELTGRRGPVQVGRAQNQGPAYHAWLEAFPTLNTQPENLTGAARAEAVSAHLNELLEAFGPGLLVLEDAHWLDSASWEALFAVRWDGLIVVSTRPQAIPPELRPDLQLRLQPLSDEAIRELVSQLPGAPDPGDWLQRAQGNPFFAQELALAVSEGVALPDSLQALIVGRIDRLVASQQLALKVASVLGQRFSLVSLIQLYPLPEDVASHARGLAEREFVVEETPAQLHFRHEVIREVAYGLLLHSQRRELHRKAAQGLEGSNLHGLLAYHWRHAGDTEKWLLHLDEASEEAFRNGLYRTVIEYLQPAPANARRHRLLGEAHHAAGNLPAARRHLEEAARLLKAPVPKGWRLWLDFNMLTMALTLACRAFFPPGLRWLERGMEPMLKMTPKVPEHDVERRREACAVHESLSVVYAFDGDMLASMHCGARTFELIAGCPPCPELARTYANSAMGMSLIGMYRLADQLGQRALAMPESRADTVTRTSILHYASMPLAITGRWEQTLEYMREAEALLDESGSKRQRAEMLAFLGYISYYRGDLDGMQAAFARVRPNPDDEHYQAWIGFTELFAAWVRGLPVDLRTVARLRAHDALLQANLHALAAVASGPDALGHVEALLGCNPPAEMAFYTSTAYEMATAALRQLPRSTAATRAFGKVGGRLKTLALFIPVTEPLRWLAEARRAEWDGKGSARYRERGLKAARKWNTPRYEQLLGG